MTVFEAAQKHLAFSPAQIVDLLEDHVDGDYVNLPDVHPNTGKKIISRLTIDAAVCRLREMQPCLFQANVVEGINLI